MFELRRANEILKAASVFFAGELDPHRPEVSVFVDEQRERLSFLISRPLRRRQRAFSMRICSIVLQRISSRRGLPPNMVRVVLCRSLNRMSTDWSTWHETYEDPLSDLVTRLGVVQGFISDFLANRSDRTSRVVSICAGKGLDLLGVLFSHPGRRLVSGRLVELDPALAAAAREAAQAAALDHIDVIVADAGLTDSYAGAVPADLVIACGVFGNISDHDVEVTVRSMPSLCAQGGTVVWTRHRYPPDLTPAIRRWFSESGFTEEAFASPGADSFSVGVHRLEIPGMPLILGQRLFTFTR
ncbi:MAG: hypothetical protein ACYDA3_13455 [Gaiellaceae bacterium]